MTTQASPHIELEVTCAWITRSGKVLLAQRPENQLWEMPGGKLMPHEKLSDCVLRELHEELGLKARVQRYLGKISHAQENRTINLYCFHCLPGEIPPQAREHLSIAWFSLPEIQNLKLCQADRKLLKSLAPLPLL